MSEETEKKKKEKELCQSVDRHSIGVDGKPDNVKCILPEGHAGDHKGVHQKRVEKRKIYDQVYGKHIDTEYEVIETDVYWNNAAEVPAKDIVKQPLQSRNKKSEIMQVVDDLLKA